MIRILCGYNKNESLILSVKIFGHANFMKHGEDIVCASISSIAFGSFSFLKKFYSKDIKCNKRENKLSFYSKKISEGSQISLSMMIHQFENVSNFYCSYVEVRKFVTK